jgi:hypothetical protein
MDHNDKRPPPLKGIQPLAFKPEDIGDDIMALFTRKRTTTAANNETEETDNDNMTKHPLTAKRME